MADSEKKLIRERKVCDTILASKRLIDSLFEEYMVEKILRGDSSETAFLNFKEHVENVVEERLYFLEKDVIGLHMNKEE